MDRQMGPPGASSGHARDPALVRLSGIPPGITVPPKSGTAASEQLAAPVAARQPGGHRSSARAVRNTIQLSSISCCAAGHRGTGGGKGVYVGAVCRHLYDLL